MSGSRHSEAQMIEALKRIDAGQNTRGVARDYGVSKFTIYAWKSKHGGMEVSEAQHFRVRDGKREESE